MLPVICIFNVPAGWVCAIRKTLWMWIKTNHSDYLNTLLEFLFSRDPHDGRALLFNDVGNTTVDFIVRLTGNYGY